MSKIILMFIKNKKGKYELCISKPKNEDTFDKTTKTAASLAGATILPIGGYMLASTTISAGLFGGAVVTSTLAALGPFGMIGGLFTLGGLAVTGYALTQKLHKIFKDATVDDIDASPAIEFTKENNQAKSDLMQVIRKSKIDSKYQDLCIDAVYKQWDKGDNNNL